MLRAFQRQHESLPAASQEDSWTAAGTLSVPEPVGGDEGVVKVELVKDSDCD